MLALHAAGHGENQLGRLPGFAVQRLEVRVGEICGVPRWSQGGLQWVGAQLPPVARIRVPGTQARRGSRRLSEHIAARAEQCVARALHQRLAVPEAQVAVAQVEQADTHQCATRKRSSRLSA